MPFGPNDQKQIDAFFAAIAPQVSAYQQDSFSFVALKSTEGFDLAFGALMLNAFPTTIPLSCFETEHVRVGHFLLSELKTDRHRFLDAIETGTLPTPYGDLLFRTGPHSPNYSAFHTPFHNVGLQNQNRLNVLSVRGSGFFALPNLELDWELKASPIPYDSLYELLSEYSLGGITSSLAAIDFVAYHVVDIDYASPISGDRAHIRLRASRGLDINHVTIGVRVLSSGKVVRRLEIPASSITWTTDPDALRGTAVVEIPLGALLHCFVSYARVSQHFAWLADRSMAQNPRIAALNALECDASALSDLIAGGKGHDARDFEAVVAWLFWASGFSAAQLGAIPRLQANPDLIIAAPRGDLAVVECTTGLLKAQHKLAILYERTQVIRRSLNHSGHQNIGLIPILVTSKERQEVAAEYPDAERIGVLVLTREDIREMVAKSTLLQDANVLYDDFVNRIVEALPKPTQGDPELNFG